MPANPEDRPILKPEDAERYAFEPRHSPLPVPNIGIFEEPTACLKINQKWATHVLGYLVGLLRLDAWINGGEFASDESARYFAHNEVQKLIEAMTIGVCDVPIDCEEVEECLVTSPSIISLQSQGSANTNAITNLQNNVTVINNSLTVYNKYTNDNKYPALPTAGNPLCGSAYRLADELYKLINKTYTDASTITVDEFLIGLLGLGGFDGSLLKALWDFAISTSTAGVPADVLSRRDAIASLIYASNLDKATTKTAINGSTFPTNTKNALVAAIDAVTDGKWYLWAFVGGQNPMTACSGWCRNDQLFTLGSWWNSDGGTDNNSGWGLTTGHRLDNVGGGSKGAQIEFLYNFPQLTTINTIEVSISTTRPAPDDNFIGYKANDSGNWVTQNFPNTGTGTYVKTWTNLALSVNSLRIGGATGYSGTTTTIVATAQLNYVKLFGTGTNPFSQGSNC